MKVLLDSSVIVEIDRKNKFVIDTVKNLIAKNHEIIISVVTISEVLVGPCLRRDFKKSLFEAKKLLSQFLWVDFDAKIAERTAYLSAYLIAEGKMIDYPDIIIAATGIESNSDYILTFNKQHFEVFEDLKKKVFTPEEFKNK